MPRKAFFLDRDGVLTKLVEDKRPPWAVDEVEFTDLAKPLLKRIFESSFLPIVVTNQPDAGRGSCRLEELKEVNQFIMKHLRIGVVYTCYHPYDGMCECRKPGAGMLRAASKDLDICLTDSILLGDRNKDIQAGKRAGCTTIRLGDDDKDATYSCQNELEILELVDKLVSQR